MVTAPRSSFLAGAVVVAAALPAQVVHVVSGGGFALQTAIQAAAAGDVLDVLPGIYQGATATRGLHVALRPGAEVATTSSGTAPSLTVQSLPAGERFLLTGGAVRGIAALQCAGEVVVSNVGLTTAFGFYSTCRVVGCTGPVVFDDVVQGVANPLVHGSFEITNCTNFSARSCTFPNVVLSGSHASLSAVTVPPVYGFVPGIRVSGGTVAIDASTFTGGATASWPTAHPGLQIDSGDVVATTSTFAASPAWTIFQTPAILNGGSLRLDSSCALVGFAPIAGTGTVQSLEVPSLAVTNGPLTMNVATTAEPGAVLVTFASLPRPPYPTPWGDAWLLPTDPVLDVALLAGGTGGFSFTFATVPPFTSLVLQSVALTPASTLVLGTPLRFVWD